MTNLASIRLKFRKITATSSPNEITDAEIDDYVNTFYLYDLPNHLRLLNLKQTYSFITSPNIDLYAFTPNSDVTIEGPVYISGNEAQLFQSRESFYQRYNQSAVVEQLAFGDGTPGDYAGTIAAVPVLRNERVLISTIDAAGNPLSAQDNGLGAFVGDVVAGSTIDYLSGAIATLVWTANIANGTAIEVQSRSYQAARPYALLFYDDTFQLFPVPDRAYKVEMDSFVTPTAFANVGDEPQLREWWQLISYGAAMKYFADNLDLESISKINPLFDEQKSLIERRTLKQISINRTNTIFSESINYGYSNWRV